MKMYKDVKDHARLASCQQAMAKYRQSQARKSNYSQAVKLASNVSLDDIIMPMGGPDPNKKQRVAETVNGKPIPAGSNRVAIEAATRAKNRIRGVPPPPTSSLPRTFKRFKSSKAPPPPPPKKFQKKDNTGPNYQNAMPTSEMYYETNAPVTLESSFIPSGTKRAKPNEKSLSSRGTTISAGPSKAPPPPPTKAINAHEMKMFVPRGLKADKDTVTIKRNKKIPPPPPKPTGNKKDDEYNKFMHSLSGI